MSCKTYEVKVYDNGRIEWRLDGKLHREDGPAVIWPDGTKYWCKNGNFIEKMDLLLFGLMVLNIGIKMVNVIEKMVLLLFGLMVLNIGLKMINVIEKMALPLFGLMELKNGI